MNLAKNTALLFTILGLISCGGDGGGGGDIPEGSTNEGSLDPQRDENATTTPSNFEPSPVPTPSSEPLDKLLGNVVFHSQRSNSSTIFEDKATFSSIVTRDGDRFVVDANTSTACRRVIVKSSV